MTPVSYSSVVSEKKQRFFFSSFLKTLPGVQRKAGGRSSTPGLVEAVPGKATWRSFSR